MTPSHGAEARTAPRKRRENYEDKARRLLTEGRLNVQRVDRRADIYEAIVRGDSGEQYEARWNSGALRWECTCPSYGICSHARALQLIVVRSAVER